MPLVKSHYNPPHIFKNGHFSTVYCGLYRNVLGVYQKRERITLSDQDFIDLARSVYITNDQRSATKTKINNKFGSKIVEVKSYTKY